MRVVPIAQAWDHSLPGFLHTGCSRSTLRPWRRQEAVSAAFSRCLSRADILPSIAEVLVFNEIIKWPWTRCVPLFMPLYFGLWDWDLSLVAHLADDTH